MVTGKIGKSTSKQTDVKPDIKPDIYIAPAASGSRVVRSTSIKSEDKPTSTQVSEPVDASGGQGKKEVSKGNSKKRPRKENNRSVKVEIAPRIGAPAGYGRAGPKQPTIVDLKDDERPKKKTGPNKGPGGYVKRYTKAEIAEANTPRRLRSAK